MVMFGLTCWQAITTGDDKEDDMSEPREPAQTRLELDPDGFAKVERLVAYEMGNTLLMLNLELQSRFGLRAEEYQVYLLIVLSTVQRFVRARETDSPYLGRIPLTPDRAGSISRRRISEVLGIPLETVRRIAARLLERGLIVEVRRGQLATPGGTLQALGQDETPEAIARRLISSVNAMIRSGALRFTDRD